MSEAIPSPHYSEIERLALETNIFPEGENRDKFNENSKIFPRHQLERHPKQEVIQQLQKVHGVFSWINKITCMSHMFKEIK